MMFALQLSFTPHCFSRWFLTRWSGYTPSTQIRPQRGKGTKPVHVVRLRSKDAYEFLKGFDLNLLRNASDKIKSMFLKGFYDGDGSVNIGSCIHVGVASKEIITLTKALLESLGILSGQINEGKTSHGTPFYSLFIGSAESALRFREKVGFSIKRKEEALTSWVLSDSCSSIIERRHRFVTDQSLIEKHIQEHPGLSSHELSKQLFWSDSKTEHRVERLLKAGKIYRLKSERHKRKRFNLFACQNSEPTANPFPAH